MLTKAGEKAFDTPHNLHYIRGKDPNDDRLVVLDNAGFHLFSENGDYKRTLLPGQGSRFRGLGSVFLQGEVHLVSIDISGPGSNVVTFPMMDERKTLARKYVQLVFQINMLLQDSLSRIPIGPTKGMADGQTKCRFLSVRAKDSRCFVTALIAKAVYEVDLIKGASRTVDLHDESEHERTFHPDQRKNIRKPVTIEPTGILALNEGMLIVANRAGNSVEVNTYVNNFQLRD